MLPSRYNKTVIFMTKNNKKPKQTNKKTKQAGQNLLWACSHIAIELYATLTREGSIAYSLLVVELVALLLWPLCSLASKASDGGFAIHASKGNSGVTRK
jgi:hypothetical protein